MWLQLIANVDTLQELQTIDVAVTRGMRGQRDELLHLVGMSPQSTTPPRAA